MTRAIATGWRNYEFTTDLPCPNGHPPGFHPLYIGMSNRPDLRYGQHAVAPWRRYATGFVVHPEVYASEADALAAERQRIRALLPLANIEHNENNPCRMYFGPPRQVARRTAVRPGRLRRALRWWRGLPRWVRRLALRAGVWLALAVALWTVSGRLLAGLVVASVVMGAAHTRRRRRRRRRR